MPNDRVNDDALQRTGPYEQVNALCESFFQEWQPETRPAFDDYLRQVADDAQLTLLRNLLHLEIERRRAAGEQPNAEEYLRKPPQHAALIRAVFLDSSSSFQLIAPRRRSRGLPPGRLGCSSNWGFRRAWFRSRWGSVSAVSSAAWRAWRRLW